LLLVNINRMQHSVNVWTLLDVAHGFGNGHIPTLLISRISILGIVWC